MKMNILVTAVVVILVFTTLVESLSGGASHVDLGDQAQKNVNKLSKMVELIEKRTLLLKVCFSYNKKSQMTNDFLSTSNIRRFYGMASKQC